MKIIKYLSVISLFFTLSVSMGCKKKPAPTDETIQNIEASSTLDYERYNLSNLSDNKLESWCEGKKDDGIGEYINITFEKEVLLESFYIKNGFGFSEYYLLNNRIKSLEISNGVDSEIISIKDTSDTQKVSLNKALTGQSFQFKIKDVYKGTKYKDTCICELRFAQFKIKQPAFYGAAFWDPGNLEKCNCEAITFSKNGRFECMGGPGTGDDAGVYYCAGNCTKVEGNKYNCIVDNEPGRKSFLLKLSGGYGYINGKRLEAIDD